MVHSDDGTPVTLVVSTNQPNQPNQPAQPTQSPSPVPTALPAVVVTQPQPSLPFTGFDVAAALLVTALLIALGVALLLSGRRHH